MDDTITPALAQAMLNNSVFWFSLAVSLYVMFEGVGLAFRLFRGAAAD